MSHMRDSRIQIPETSGSDIARLSTKTTWPDVGQGAGNPNNPLVSAGTPIAAVATNSTVFSQNLDLDKYMAPTAAGAIKTKW